jgi:hypothetical protein
MKMARMLHVRCVQKLQIVKCVKIYFKSQESDNGTQLMVLMTYC